MQREKLVPTLDRPEEVKQWLQSIGLKHLNRSAENLANMIRSGLTPDLIHVICGQIGEHLAGLSDPDMALNNLDRYFTASRNPISLGAFFERDPEALPILLQIFSTSQYLSDLLISDPESFDLLRITGGHPVAREVLVDEIVNESNSWQDDRDVKIALRRHKNRETLRIAYGDIVRHQRVDTVATQISFLADAICEAALRAAVRRVEMRHGTPRRTDGHRARLVILALGKLGGAELNYSSDIDLIFLSDDDTGKTDGPRSVSNGEFFERVLRYFVKYLTETTELGTAYRVDLRLRPDGKQGLPVIGITAALRYYDVSGRTWERQAFIKARPIAGDLDLGQEFLDELQPWIYRRYLNRADISGIKALKRRIEQRTKGEGGDQRNVKTGRGGIRDIEFVVQFLQLLNGGDLPQIRTGNTLNAIAQLEQVGCLTLQERTILEENYDMLRKLEHRLQIMFDLQTHTMPESDDELRKLAIRMGYAEGPHRDPLEAFRADFKNKTELNRKILAHLLQDAFGGDEPTEPEVDLVLDPEPSSAFIHEVLGKYGFERIDDAYRNLMELATEKIPFLSTRRCRMFLASIAPRLLAAISRTPDPDSTLVDLSKVSDSIGGKGVLWELFSFNPSTLQLYVQLCAATPYLSGILTSNPGMIDELMDSLMLDNLPSHESLQRALSELAYRAEDIEPILHSFKISLHLLVGVRDILGKDDIRNTHRILSDTAEVCLTKITAREYERLSEKFGVPTVGSGDRSGQPCELITLAMGKLGGQEPNYHSDLDVVFLYEAEGSTRHEARSRSQLTTTNQHFFGQLGQRIIKVITQLGPQGRLYELDPRLRPTGRSGSLAVSLDEFAKYFATGQGQLWERQALCKARPVYGSDRVRELTSQVVRTAIIGPGWRPENAEEIRQMRRRLEDTASKLNLKRGVGGTVDIEFTVQMLQLKHVAEHPEVLCPGTLDAIDALLQAGCMKPDDGEFFLESYRFLRNIEARLRLMNTTARHDMPSDELELKKIAYLLDYPDGQSLLNECQRYTCENRKRFERIFDEAGR